MTTPREIHPGRCYLVTRRCTQREFLLRPDDAIDHARSSAERTDAQPNVGRTWTERDDCARS